MIDIKEKIVRFLSNSSRPELEIVLAQFDMFGNDEWDELGEFCNQRLSAITNDDLRKKAISSLQDLAKRIIQRRELSCSISNLLLLDPVHVFKESGLFYGRNGKSFK